MLVSRTNPLGVELFSYVNAYFRSNIFAFILATWVISLTRPGDMQIFWNKRNFLHTKKCSTPTGLVWNTGRDVTWKRSISFPWYLLRAGHLWRRIFQIQSTYWLSNGGNSKCQKNSSVVLIVAYFKVLTFPWLVSYVSLEKAGTRSFKPPDIKRLIPWEKP